MSPNSKIHLPSIYLSNYLFRCLRSDTNLPTKASVVQNPQVRKQMLARPVQHCRSFTLISIVHALPFSRTAVSRCSIVTHAVDRQPRRVLQQSLGPLASPSPLIPGGVPVLSAHLPAYKFLPADPPPDRGSARPIGVPDPGAPRSASVPSLEGRYASNCSLNSNLVQKFRRAQ